MNTSGFAFWNGILIDSDGKAKYAMGYMTMTSGYDTVEWIHSSLVAMYPPVQEKTVTVMSDLDNKFVFHNVHCLVTTVSCRHFLIHRCHAIISAVGESEVKKC
ncbi:hypothetical protein ACHAWX_000101 [Stephanocyclus meneghinianus]